jgi:hypothetical protein
LLDIVGNTFDATNRSVGAFEYIPPGIFRTLSDVTSTYDADTKYFNRVSSLQDLAEIEDFSLVGEILLTSYVADVISVYDNIISSGALTGRFLIDVVSVTETSVRSLMAARLQLDILSYVNDSMARVADVYREAFEALSVVDDELLSMVIRKRRAFDTITADDLITHFVGSFRTLHEITDVEDRIDRTLRAIRDLQDETSIDDYVISSASAVLRTYVFILVNMR